MADVKTFFSVEQQEEIKKAIVDAEHQTSGQIRVHLENKCSGDAMERAVLVLHKLEMHKTNHRNSVLFYVALSHRKFAIVGDEGVHATVPENFWDDVKEHIIKRFKESKFTEGLCEGIRMAGDHLKKNFPHTDSDTNELPDDISFDTNA
ncbi:MAG: TPM domain-containing protein [Bacteroidia bacterium]